MTYTVTVNMDEQGRVLPQPLPEPLRKWFEQQFLRHVQMGRELERQGAYPPDWGKR